MIQEYKELLLRDLCARLPYGVKLDFYSRAMNEHLVSILLGIEPNNDDKPIIAKVNNGAYTLGQDHIKPYLRPMSSMTEEEREEYKHIAPGIVIEDGIRLPNINQINWLNAHHFDYRGLIEKGLAIEAPEGMYK